MKKIFLIAEIGWNHLGNISLAKKMIKAAAASGADICKFQTWSEKNLKPGKWDMDGRREIYRKAQLSEKKHIILKKECIKNKVQFCTSIFSLNSISFLKKINLKIIKIPSHEVYNIDLIKKCLKSFDKVLVSLGAANWSEIKKILLLRSKKLVFMHCVSAYPLEAKNVNFPKLDQIADLTNNTLGYSGHYSDIDDAVIAISKGARYIEKHFTTNNNLKGRDNKFAITPKKFKQLSDFRDIFEKMNIYKGLNVQNCEQEIYKNYRGRWDN